MRIYLPALTLIALLAISNVSPAHPALVMQTDSTQQAELWKWLGPHLLEHAAIELRLLASNEQAYLEGPGNGKYGFPEELIDAVPFFYAHPDDAPQGFTLQWFLNEDRSDFAIVALPKDDPEMIGLMIDSVGEVFAFTQAESDGYDEHNLNPIVDAENDEITGAGQYSFIDVPELHDRWHPITLLLNSESTSFLAKWTQDCLLGDPGSAYLSGTGLAYFVGLYDSEIGSTLAEWRGYDRLLGFEARAKGTLRSIASSELAYRSIRGGEQFGSFQDLSDDLFIAEGYTPETMVEEYRLIWTLNRDKTDFAVVALPSDECSDELGIFMVDSSQVVVELIPSDTELVLHSWDAIIEAEQKAWETQGRHVWLEEDEITDGFGVEDLYIDEGGIAYVLSWPFDTLREMPHYCYLSETGTLYERKAVM